MVRCLVPATDMKLNEHRPQQQSDKKTSMQLVAGMYSQERYLGYWTPIFDECNNDNEVKGLNKGLKRC